MRNFFKKNTNVVLTSLAIFFLAIIVGYFAVGFSYIVTEVNDVNANRTPGSQISDFNINAAAALDYKGLATSTAVSADASSSSSTP